jgi:hypothetical protein
MKLLIVGSVLVIATVLGWATMNWTIATIVSPRAGAFEPDYRFVTTPREPDRPSAARAVVWQTSTGPTDCEVLVERLKRSEEHDPLATLLSSSEARPSAADPKDACRVFELGQIEPGARVEVVDEYYGQMARVRILNGPLRGRQGCIETAFLTTDRPR